MSGMNLSLQIDLVSLLMPPSGVPSASAPLSETGESPPAGFDELLQKLSQAQQPPAESTLPELLVVVPSLAGPANLLEGIEKPAVTPEHAKEKKAATLKNVADIQTMAGLQALLGFVPQICVKPGPSSETEATTEESPTERQSVLITDPALPSPDPPLEKAAPDTPAKPVLNLHDFDVRRFEFKTEVEIASVQPKLIRVTPLPAVHHGPLKPRAPELKSIKGSSEVAEAAPPAPSVFESKHEAPRIEAPEAVQRVQVVIEPPPPPPVARQISMDVGDLESQVRVVIRERNGDLAVQFGAATERLRENLQNASPLLLHELQRDSTHQSISLDFSSFGTATEGGRESHQEPRRKKALKPEAVFADVAELTYLSDGMPSVKTF